MLRYLISDPRTIAREIPGFFEAVCPQLRPGIVAYMNRTRRVLGVQPLCDFEVAGSSLQRAMLFELGFAVGESLLERRELNWAHCLDVAFSRQRKYFDARLPDKISELDKRLALRVGNNIAFMVEDLSRESSQTVVCRPPIPGLQWIASGVGDFSVGSTLIEVKCGKDNFSAADYRQIVTYWLLSYAGEIEGRCTEWVRGVLLNPRSGVIVEIDFSEFIGIIAAGRAKVEVLQSFISMIGVRGERA
jgi:hypothetical protein